MKIFAAWLASLYSLVRSASLYDSHTRQVQLRGKQPPPSGVSADNDTLVGETVDQATHPPSKRQFDTVDANGDGQILLWEYKKVSKADVRLTTYRFECSDENLDGALDYHEFTYAREHPEMLDDCLGTMFAFKMLDKNKDGHLTQKEMWKSVGDSQRFDQRWAFTIACSDPNQDGKVSPMEFTADIYDCVEQKVNAANEEFVDFNRSDQNKDGCVNEEELTIALSKLLGHNYIENKDHYGGKYDSVQNLAIRWMYCVDDSMDHCLQSQEYDHLLNPDNEKAYCLGSSFDAFTYDMDFQIMDSSRDGKVSKQEYFTWVGRIELEVQHEDAERMFESSDTNQDGFIDHDEFHNAGSSYEGDGPNALFLHTFAPGRNNKTHYPISLKKKL